MLSIQQFTQSRLSILLFDKVTNALLRGIPVYAEMGMTLDTPPYTIRHVLDFVESETPLKNWLSSHTFALGAINGVIVSNVTEADFKAIADKHALYNGILQKIKDGMAAGAEGAETQSLITKVVLSDLQKLEVRTSPQADTQNLVSFPLGTLASDHAGYLSYDLTSVARRARTMTEGDALATAKISFFAYPLGREDLKQDISQQSRLNPEVIFGKLPLDFPEEFERVKLPSMQTPGLEDWYLSPGSFSLNPAFFIGTDGCENLYPANFATQEFSFFQIVRGNKILIRQETHDPTTTSEVRAGWSLEYRVSWQPLGHTIGEIVYSLPLAPGETVKIAVIDWARKSIDSRTEDLTVKEQLAHNTHRDRNISETVDAAMQEWQRGGSFMGGVAGSFGAGGFGISGALGGGYSTSSGDRSVHASTVQQISDAFAQASSSVRELRSTIVIQSDQQEHAKAETRVVANHNHSHALTMLYYEVLRHYKVATQFMRVRPSLLVRYPHIDFSSLNEIVRYRRTLESVLLDSRYLSCFEAVQKLVCFTSEFARKAAQAALAPNLDDMNELGELKLVIKTKTPTGTAASVSIRTRNSDEVYCVVVSPLWGGNKPFGSPDVLLPNSVDDLDERTTVSPINYRQGGQENVFVVKPYKTILWNDVDGLVVNVGAGPAWEIESIRAIATVGAKTWVMIDVKEPVSVAPNGKKFLPAQSYKDIPKDPADLLKDDDERCCVDRLKRHLSNNAFHYEKAVWLLEDQNERADRFRQMLSDGTAILDLIDNRPLDVLGDYVVFPARTFHENNRELNAIEKVSVERLMTLPTRGVFAEARLGHCNASEEIDDTRFWDWQTSPITEEAPGIADVNINDSKNATPNLAPTQMPSSIVNIVTPQNLPDPSGLISAMNLLGKSDVFRDMSVSKEVEDLLEKLAEKSVSIGEAANKAKEIQTQREANKTSNTSIAPTAPAPPPKITPAETQQQIKISENQANKGTITKTENQDNVKKAIDRMLGGNKGSKVSVTVNFKHSISGPLDGEFGIEFIGPIGDAFFTPTVGGLGAGNVTLQTGAEYTIQIKGRRTRLPRSLDTIALIPAVGGNPAFNLDVSNHITKRDVPIEANVVATISKGRKSINLTIVAEEVAKDIKIAVKVTGSGTLKTDLEGELGLKLFGLDVGHVKAGVAVETTIGGELAVELPIEFKRLTGNVTASKNDLVL